MKPQDKLLIVDDDKFTEGVTYHVLRTKHGSTLKDIHQKLQNELPNVHYINPYDPEKGFSEEKEPNMEIDGPDHFVMMSGSDYQVVIAKEYSNNEFIFSIIPTVHSEYAGEIWMSKEDNNEYYEEYLKKDFLPIQKIFNETLREMSINMVVLEHDKFLEKV
jgi:hypothetical protein